MASELEARFGPRSDLPNEVKAYLARTAYPPSVGRLSPDQADLLEPNRRFETFRPVADGPGGDPDAVIHVRLTTDRYYYEGDHTVVLELAARRGDQPIQLERIEASVVREARGGEEGRAVPLRFRWTGSAYDATFDTARFADHHGPLRVQARIEYARGQFHEETLRLFLTPEGRIPARFTGEVQSRIVRGSLRVEVGIDVEQPGTYRIDANLYGGDGRPLAFSAFKGELNRSSRFVPIGFFGRVLLDAGAAGAFRVGEIRGYRFLERAYPDRERIPDLAGHHALEAVDPNTLSGEEHMSEHRLRMVELMLEDVARGLPLDRPGPPSPGGSGADPSGPSRIDATN